MRGSGTVEAIHVAPGPTEPMEWRDTVEAVAGSGLRGDRYFDGTGTFADAPLGGNELTLTEAEAVEAVAREAEIDLSFADHRRNVTTRDVALNHLVGERFRIGNATCVGVRLCEPCDHLERLTEDGVMDAYAHRGGLRADIVESGTVAVGDDVEPL